MYVCLLFLTGLAFFCIAGRVYFASIEGIWDGSWDTFAYLVEL
jgi:hypothetical protein